MSSSDLLIVAGEASGDLHGARLLTELRRLNPSLEPFGLGGEELDAAGLELVARGSEIAVVGILEALPILRRAREIFAELLAEVDRRGAKRAILIDFPDFNLRLAKELKRRGVKVAYYISPQVWAWRKGRVRSISRDVDLMLVLLPFEVDFYAHHGVDAVHVGHPLIDEVPELLQVWEEVKRPGEARHGQPYRIALLPGSRKSEINVLLPVLLETAALLHERVDVRFSIIRASTIGENLLRKAVETCRAEVEIVHENRFQTIADSHLALCAAGTATLEVGLLKTPMIVTHRVAMASYVLGRLLVRLPYTSLVNLLLDRRAVPELLQFQANPNNLCEATLELLEDTRRIDSIRANLAELRERIGPPGASARAAAEIERSFAQT